MKIRTGFVSNSSSTCYVCEVCGEAEGGWDSGSIDDYGFARCVNGHTICESHIKLPDKVIHAHEIPEDCCPICTCDDLSLDELPSLMASLLGMPLNQAKTDLLKMTRDKGRAWAIKTVKKARTDS